MASIEPLSADENPPNNCKYRDHMIQKNCSALSLVPLVLALRLESPFLNYSFWPTTLLYQVWHNTNQDIELFILLLRELNTFEILIHGFIRSSL